jgi:hypothetical protein
MYRTFFFGSDTHCGNQYGLTPPGFQNNEQFPESAPRRVILWDWFEKEIKKHQPFDIAFWNGDLIDGNGEKDGGTDLLCTDRFKQCDIAAKVISIVGGKQKFITLGTPFHTGKVEDFEKKIGPLCGIPDSNIRPDITVNVRTEENPFIINLLHKVGNTGVFNGQGTALLKAVLNNLLLDSCGYTKKANLIVRSHIHRFAIVSDAISNTTAFSTPCLCGYGAKYGRQMDSLPLSFGFVVVKLDMDSTGPNGVSVDPCIASLKLQSKDIQTV